MPPRKEPTYKYPCIECKKPVKWTQLGIYCEICELWIHFKCSNLSKSHYDFLQTNVGIPYNCQKCRPLFSVPDEISNNSSNPVVDRALSDYSNANDINNNSSLQGDTSIISSDCEFSDAHASDFTLESVNEVDSDSDLRGLNFAGLPVHHESCSKVTMKSHVPIGVRTVNYKYPCNICLGPCKENVQDSIQCTWCDEWVHQKCTNLSYNQFLKYCSPENINLPYYCDICEFGSVPNTKKQTCISANSVIPVISLIYVLILFSMIKTIFSQLSIIPRKN